MGKLVKRAELSILGTLGIALFSYTHMPAILSSLDGASSTESSAYSASAAAAVTPYVDQTVSDPSPVTITTTPIAQTYTDTAGAVATSSVQNTDATVAPPTTDANAVLPTDNAAQDPSPAPDTQPAPSDSQ